MEEVYISKIPQHQIHELQSVQKKREVFQSYLNFKFMSCSQKKKKRGISKLPQHQIHEL